MPASALLYEKLSQTLTYLIDNGTLPVGGRLPSLRALSRRERVSMATVMKTYETLESRGLIEARPQSGFYVRRSSRELPPRPGVRTRASEPMAVTFSSLIQEVLDAAAREDLIALGAALPSPDLLPVKPLCRALAAASRRLPTAAVCTTNPRGWYPLRQAIARRALEAGCTLGAEDLIVTHGCTEALVLALRAVTRPGDAVAIESPTYFGILQILQDLGLNAVELPGDAAHGLNVDAALAVAEHGEVAAFVLSPLFSNPLGSLMPEGERRRLVTGLSNHGLPIIEDDIYGEFHFASGPRPRALRAFDRDGLVLYCGSFSKTLASGFRVGWIAPGRFHDRVWQLKTTTSLATAMPSQLAITDYLNSGGYDRHLRRMRRTCAVNLDRMRTAVASHFPRGTQVSRPAGGFVLWIRHPELNAGELYRRALAEGISITPGGMFTAGGTAYPDCLRLNAAHTWNESLALAVKRLGKMATTLVEAA